MRADGTANLPSSPKAQFALILSVKMIRLIEESGATQVDALTALSVARELATSLDVKVTDQPVDC